MTAKAGSKAKPIPKKPAKPKAKVGRKAGIPNKKVRKAPPTKTGAVGRPSSYRQEYAQETFELCLLGFTDEKLATHFDVAINTISGWKKAHPEFLGAMRRGKALADGNVANALFQRALGFETTKDVLVGKGEDARIETLFEKLPPDTQAAKFWLKNRQPDHWRETALEETGTGLFSIVIHERLKTDAERARDMEAREKGRGQ